MSRIQNLPDAAPRLVVVDGGKLGIKTYGVDNGYPQRMKNLYNASVSAKMCAELYASYMVGKGFEDPNFYKAKINQNGLTPDKLLRLLSGDKSEFRGFALHFNYNALYQIEDIAYIPFENCRLGDGENENKIGVYDNWYNSAKGGENTTKSAALSAIFLDSCTQSPLKTISVNFNITPIKGLCQKRNIQDQLKLKKILKRLEILQVKKRVLVWN